MRLDSLCSAQSGGTPRRSESRFYGGSMPWAKIGDLDAPDGVVNDTEEHLTDEGVDAIRGRVFPAGTLLLAMYGSVGKLAVAGRDLTTNQAILGIQVEREDLLDQRYLFWWLESQHQQLQLMARGVTQKNLSARIVRGLDVPLPPLPEQRRIAAILDEADALRRKRREAVALLEELQRSAFLEMFGDPVTNPRGWPVMPLRRVVSSIEPGWSAKGSDRPAQAGEWGVLKISAVTTGMFRPEENKSVGNPVFSKEPVVPRRGDLLFSRANTRELVAATCLVDLGVSGLFLPDKLWRISCDPGHAVVEWLRFLLAHDGFRATLTKKATGTSGSMLNVSQEKLLDLDAPVPPLDVQRRFAQAVWAGSEERSRVSSAVEEQDGLFHALLHRAFTGDL